jgi:D-aminoacyl-tRNA deacylase
MRALIQRVSEAHVSVGGALVGQIGLGLVVFIGVRKGDTTADADYLARKISHLRVFADQDGKMNRSVLDVAGQLMIVSQFTLYGETRKGNRPSYSAAADPEVARVLYEYFIGACRNTGCPVETGVFQAHMEVKLVNDGPVTLLCSSESDIF